MILSTESRCALVTFRSVNERDACPSRQAWCSEAIGRSTEREAGDGEAAVDAPARHRDPRQTDGATSGAHRYSRRKRHEAALHDALSMGAVPRMVGLLSTDSQRSEGRGIRTTRGVRTHDVPRCRNSQTRTPACEGLNPRVIVQVSPNLSRENNRIGLSNAGGSLVNTRALVHDVPKSRGNPRRRSSAGRAAVS